MFIYPYRNGSKSVALLKQRLNAKTIRLENSKFKGGDNKIVINWGNSNMKPEFKDTVILNHPDQVAIASNKLHFFNHVEGKFSIPEFTTEEEVVKQWLEEEATVVGRQKLTGHSGQGIVLITDEASFKPCKLYTKYIPKKDEYRVHVLGGSVIDVQRKAKKQGVEEVNWKIRSHDNGFIYMRKDIKPDADVLAQATAAVETLGLHFGAVDVIWNEYRKKSYVLEVNTAPGLEGQTLDNYVKGFEYISKSPNEKLKDVLLKLQKEKEDFPKYMLGKAFYEDVNNILDDDL